MDYRNGIEGAPEAIGPYSQAAVHNGLAFLSGQVPIDPASGKLVEGGIDEQTVQVMKNLTAVLKGLGLDFSAVIKTNIYLADMNDFQAVNTVYAEWMGDARPARATVQVAGLPIGAQVEIDMIAAI